MHVAITGASTGIGAALAREFAGRGADLTLVARREALLLELSQALSGVRIRTVAHDLADPPKATDWVQAAEAELGPIDVLVNNAGSQLIGRTYELDVAAGEVSVQLNMHTPLRLICALLPGMLERNSGTIVNVCSMAAIAPTPGMLYYNASKAGLAAASEALRGELRGSGVNVVTVYPGIIETDMGKKGLAAYHDSRSTALQPRGSVEVLAQRIWRAVKGRRGRIIYPRIYVMARWFPGITRFMMDRFTPQLRSAEPDAELP
jgi:short-subunit dehydrogenase